MSTIMMLTASGQAVANNRVPMVAAPEDNR